MNVDASEQRSEQTQISRTIFLLSLAAFASTSAQRVLDPALPVLSQEFSVTTGQAADVVKVFALAYGLLQFLYGPVGDRFGKYKTLAWATLACAGGNILILFAEQFEMIVFGRFLSGATAAAIIPLSMAWIGDHVPYEQRQATLAKFMIGTIMGINMGLVVGGTLTDWFGWRASFWVLSTVYILIGGLLLVNRKKVPESPPGSSGFQLIGPIRQVVRVPWARIMLLVVLLEGALVFGVMSYVPTYLQFRHEITSMAAGLVTALFGIGSLLYVARARWLIGTLGEVRMVRAGGWLIGLGYAVYVLGPIWWSAIFASLCCGFAYYLVHAVLQTNATQMVPKVRGTAVSLFASCLFAGHAIGVSLGGTVVDHFGVVWVILAGAVLMPVLALYFAKRLAQHHRLQSTE
ncbi:MFS transporter [Orrella sp. 11846]|uniref:MFS transporter n=1 Tax=Orrella sp. 11846 TaxID=3409913 RepID=UPI003B59A66A